VVFWWYGFHIKAGAVEAGDERTHQWIGRLSAAQQSLLPLRDPLRCCHRLRRSGAEAISVPALHPLSGRIRPLQFRPREDDDQCGRALTRVDNDRILMVTRPAGAVELIARCLWSQASTRYCPTLG